jgi:hypothetical protein
VLCNKLTPENLEDYMPILQLMVDFPKYVSECIFQEQYLLSNLDPEEMTYFVYDKNTQTLEIELVCGEFD